MGDIVSIIGMLIALAFLVWLGNLYVGGAWRRYDSGRVTVNEHEAGLRYREGRLVEVLGAGRYATWPGPVSITRLDMREQSVTVAGQEMLTADQLSVRVSVIASHRIADARAYATHAQSPTSQLYHLVQTALREAVAAHTLDALLADRNATTAGMAEAIADEAKALGIAIVSVKLLDLTLAGPAKQAYADLWRAQKEGLAALERARGEQAALRALANAARMLKDNPELMNLRLLQALAGAPGKTAPTLVLGGAVGLAPVSRNGGADAGEPAD